MKVCLVLISLALVTAGCSERQSLTNEQLALNRVKLISPSKEAKCEASDKVCRIRLEATINKKGRCVLKSIDGDVLNISGKGQVRLVWNVKGVGKDDNLQFCPLLGDGVFLKDEPSTTNPQFSDAAIAKDSDGNDDPNVLKHPCKPNYRWNNLNNDGLEYEYVLRFRDLTTNVACVFDPWIKNGK